MSNSLRDQLVKAGLATASQARKVEQQQQKLHRSQNSKAARKGRGSAATDVQQNAGAATAGKAPEQPLDPAAVAKARARQVQAEKVERDRAAARIRNAKAAEKAQRAEIRQLILTNDQRVNAVTDDDLPYNFIHGKKIKRIYVPPVQRDALSSGKLVIVNNDGRYHIVAAAVADKIASRDPKRILRAQSADQQAGDNGELDDYYKQFEVPDDLNW